MFILGWKERFCQYDDTLGGHDCSDCRFLIHIHNLRYYCLKWQVVLSNLEHEGGKCSARRLEYNMHEVAISNLSISFIIDLIPLYHPIQSDISYLLTSANLSFIIERRCSSFQVSPIPPCLLQTSLVQYLNLLSSP